VIDLVDEELAIYKYTDTTSSGTQVLAKEGTKVGINESKVITTEAIEELAVVVMLGLANWISKMPYSFLKKY
jgi:hypothetical protein